MLLAEAARLLAPLGAVLIASISADTAEDFGQVAARVSEAGPALIEVNISCPNVAAEHGEMFAASPAAVGGCNPSGQSGDLHPLHREALPECLGYPLDRPSRG